VPFIDSLDIANAALFRLGAMRIQSVTENTKNNNTMSFLYDKLRQAELRRNVWRFATRRTVIRPITTTTLQIAPSAWSSTLLYLPGAIVSDANGSLWISTQAENLNNQPGQSGAWDQYFGPLTADIYDPTQAYNAGELVYMFLQGAGSIGAAGYVVFQSQTNFNLQTPASSFPGPWSSTTTYAAGQQVIGLDNNIYMSLINNNLNIQPAYNSNPTSWANTGATAASYPNYFNPQLNNIGTFPLIGPPNVVTAWNGATQYTTDQCVSYNGAQWRSLIPANLNNTPAQPPSLWSATTTYGLGQQITGPDMYIYTSLVNGNLDNNPSGSAFPTLWTNTGVLAAWSMVPTLFPAALGWLPLQCSLTNLTFVYPVGSGPAEQTESRNVYRLPAGYLRTAPQDPKAGSSSILGAPTGIQYEDWDLESNFLVSRDCFPIVFRFVADCYLVSQFDAMFCEGLACRLAYEACEDLTQSAGKQTQVASAYKVFMTEARAVNGIETGPTEPPVDDWLTTRA
jgi:hypothetical protein